MFSRIETPQVFSSHKKKSDKAGKSEEIWKNDIDKHLGQYGVGQTIPRLDQKKMAQKKTNNVDTVKVKKVEGEGEKTNKGNSRKSTSRVRE